MSRRVRRKLKRLCPECEESRLELVEYNNKNNGIIYSETVIECPVCRYTQEGKTPRRKEIDNATL